jgi:hypothetical protein
MPVLVMSGQPFAAFVPVGPDQVELGAAASCPAELELDDAAGCYTSRPLGRWPEAGLLPWSEGQAATA